MNGGPVARFRALLAAKCASRGNSPRNRDSSTSAAAASTSLSLPATSMNQCESEQNFIALADRLTIERHHTTEIKLRVAFAS